MIYSIASNPNQAAAIIDRENNADFHREYAAFLDILNSDGISVADQSARNDLIAAVHGCIAAAESNAFDKACIFQGMNNGDEDVETVRSFPENYDGEPGELDFFQITDRFEGKSLVSAFTDSEDTAFCRDGMELHFSSMPGGNADSGLHIVPALDQRGQPKLLCTLCPYGNSEDKGQQ